jgi:predicted exporter
VSFKKSDNSLLFVWLFVTSLLAAVLAYQVSNNPLRFDANILSLLNIDDSAGKLAKVASEPYQNKALLLVQHPENESVKNFLRKIQLPLNKIDQINAVSFDPSANLKINELVTNYAKYPLSFLSDEGQSARDKNDYSYIVQRYMKLLSQPANPLVTLSIQSAPFLNVADWFASKLQHAHWKPDQEFIYAEDGNDRYYPVFIEFESSAVQLDQVVETVHEIEQILTLHYPKDINLAPLKIVKSGLIFHSAAVTGQARFETQLFGGLSLIGVLFLTLFSFKSIRPLFNVALLISASMFAGMTALLLVFAKIHLLSLVFAISLIGIAVDYAYHILLTARYTGLRGKPLAKYIAPALLMGGGTTLVSYLLLLFLPIPLLQQVAVFVGAGIAFAIFTGLTVVAWWPGQKSSLALPIEKNMPQRSGIKVLIGLMCLACLAALPGWQFADDISIFNSTPQALIDDEIQTSRLAGNQQYPRFINIVANDQEQLLQRFETVRRVFKITTEDQFELRAIDQWLPSLKQQTLNTQWLQQGVENNQLNIITSLTSPQVVDSMLKASENRLTLENVPTDIQQLYPTINQQGEQLVGIMSYMGPLDDTLFQKIQGQLDFSISYYDQPAEFSAALSKLRLYVMYFLGMAVIALILLMVFRYGVKSGAIMASVPLLTAMSALALTQLISGYITIFNLLACILILALNVDYVVFLREYGRLTHVLKAILLSAATSALAFGVMIFSSTPAIWQFGLTVLLGVSLGWGFCNLLPSNFVGKKNNAPQ